VVGSDSVTQGDFRGIRNRLSLIVVMKKDSVQQILLASTVQVIHEISVVFLLMQVSFYISMYIPE
jgi:hypothetical protein